MNLSIDTRKCPAQQEVCTAIPSCPTGALQYETDEQAPLGGRIVIIAHLCDGCGECVSNCCGQAIIMVNN